MCHCLIVRRELFIFQQDGAIPNKARDTVWFLEQATPEFMSPDQITPNSVWWDILPCGIPKYHVYKLYVQNVDGIKKRLLVVWYVMEHISLLIVQ